MPDTDLQAATRQISAAEAIREATEQAMAADPSVYVMGEGVTDPKGIFGTTLGLRERFGADRVIEMPIAENGQTGVAIGSALMGQRPMLIHQRVEFCLLAMEQLINNAAKLHFVSGGVHKVPLVIRLIVGRGWGQGPGHSQSLEPLFSYVPGLKVVMPATAADAKGLLLGAIADDNPVIMIEHRWIHYASGQVAIDPVPMALDGPARMHPGDACTVVGTSYMSLECLQAVRALAEEGCHAELFDLRVLRPLNIDPIVESVRRTGRLVVVDTGYATYGIGAEIVARVVEQAFGSLKAAPYRMGLPDCPTPSSRGLTGSYYVTATDIADRIADLAGMPAAAAVVGERLREMRGALPPDVPHSSFRGPF